jgi:hypothetical protein
VDVGDDEKKQHVAKSAYHSSNFEVTTMKMTRVSLIAVAIAATWLTFTAESQAQGRPGGGRAGIGGGLGRGVPLAGAGRRGIGRGAGRGFAGSNTLLYGNTGHEFARTIPRVFGESILPYFSLYPPVYYSQPVPRPYGFSPFALPPGMQPAEGYIAAAEPEVTINPFYKPASPDVNEAEPKKQQTVALPQFIENPYFVKQLTPEQSKKLAGTIEPALGTVGLR